MTRVFIIGAGRGCQVVLEQLVPLPYVKILGVADKNPAAFAIKTAQNAGIPIVLTNPFEAIKTQKVDVVFDLTGDAAMKAELLAQPDPPFEVATGRVTNLLINAMIEAIEKNHLLKKHLEISLMIAQSKTLEEVFNTIVEGGMEMTDMPVGSLALFHKEKDVFTLLSQKGLPPGLSQRASYPIRIGGLTQYILANEKPTVISDLATHEGLDASTLVKEGIRSLIAIPLFSEGALLGILYYDDLKPRVYPSGLINVLGQFATEAVIAIQKQKAITEIYSLASKDTITGLYNRNQLVLQLKEVLHKAEKQGETVALLIADIDRFKEINETLGYQYADQVLKKTADCIRVEMEQDGAGDPALLFRSGVDEIAVVLPNTTEVKALHKATGIRKAVQGEGQKVFFPLDVSIGATLYPDHGQSADQLITQANQALLMAKKTDEKICVGSSLPLLESSRVAMKFEPVVDLIQNEIIGFEALSRDLYAKLSVLDLFEKYAKLGQLPEMKRICFLSQLRRAQEISLSQVFLNVDSTLLKQCEWIQKPKGLEVVLEISESESLHDLSDYLQITAKWKTKGFKFAIDDFGAGFISLPFISQLNPDYIKVDRSVILQAVASPRFRQFLHGLIIALQKNHAHRIIAEGIETKTELQIMREMGIDLIQGFLLKEMGYHAPDSKD